MKPSRRFVIVNHFSTCFSEFLVFAQLGNSRNKKHCFLIGWFCFSYFSAIRYLFNIF